MKILKTLGVVVGLNIVDYLIGPATTIILAKALSVEDWGFLSWIGTLIGLITTFFTLGLGQYNYKNIPGRPEDQQYQTLGRSLFIELSVTALGSIAVLLWMRDDLLRYGILAYFVARVLFVVINNELIRFLGFQKKNILKSIVAVLDARLWLLPLLGFLFFGAITVESTILSMLIGSTVTLMALLFFVKRKSLTVNFRFSRSFAKEALRFGLPLLLVDLGMYLQEMASRYALKLYSTYEVIGLFAFAYSWLALIFKLGMLFVYTLQPSFSETFYQYKNGATGALEKLKTQLKFVFKYSAAAILGLTIAFEMNYTDFIVLVGNERYAETATASLLLALFPFFMFAAYFYQILAVLRDDVKTLPVFYFIAGGLNLLVNFTLVPALGYNASALASTLGYLVLTGLLVYRGRGQETILSWTAGEIFCLLLFLMTILVVCVTGHLLISSFFVRMAVVGPLCVLAVGILFRRTDLAALKTF